MADIPQVVVTLELGWLGDSVMTLPAMRALRLSMPHARLVRVCNARLVPFFEGCPWIDELLPFDKDAPKARAGFDLLRRIRRLRPSHFFNLHTPDFNRPLSLYWRDQFFARATGAAHRAAYYHSFDGALLTHGVPRQGFGAAGIDLEMLRVVAPFLSAAAETPMDYWHTDLDERAATELVADGLRGIGKAPTAGVYVVAPFGKRATREWSNEHWVAAMAQITETTGLVPVLLGAIGDLTKVAPIVTMARSPLVNLVGATSIKVAAAVMAHSRLVVAIDSGLMHLAALTRRPLIALFTSGHPTRWRPIAQAPQVVLTSGVDCAPCFRDTCDQMRCRAGISVASVVAAAGELLKPAAAGPSAMASRPWEQPPRPTPAVASASWTIGLTTFNRPDILAKMQASFSLSRSLQHCHLRVFDDCSTAYDTAHLAALFPTATQIVRRPQNLGSDQNIREMFQDFLATEDRILVAVDSDLIFHPDWLAAARRALPLSDGILTLYNSALHPAVRTLELDGVRLVEKEHIGSAGVVMTRELVRAIVEHVPSSRTYDWDWCRFLRKNGVRIFSTEQSWVQHIGIHGTNANFARDSELGLGFSPGNPENGVFAVQFFEAVLSAKDDLLDQQRRMIADREQRILEREGAVQQILDSSSYRWGFSLLQPLRWLRSLIRRASTSAGARDARRRGDESCR